LKAIAKSRNLPLGRLKADADELKLRSVQDYVAAGYIDATAYRDEFYSAMKSRMGIEKIKSALDFRTKYVQSLNEKGSGNNKIAVVYAGGDIVGGRGDGTQIAADDMAATLKK
jgi:hypothetical protein